MITGISDLAGSRILCIDPDPKTRKFVSEKLSALGLSVRLAEDGVEGLRAALSLPRPELIIMEFALANMASTEVIQRLRTRGNWVRIILTTSHPEDDDAHLLSINNAVIDIMGKPFSDQSLQVRTIAALRRAAVKKSVFRYADLSLDLATRHCIRGTRPMQLTPSETELLLYFIERPEVPLSSERLREEVWGEDRQSSSEHALLPRISRLRQKLHGPGEPIILHTVPSMGYMLAIPNADDPTLAGIGELPWPGSFDQFT
ncbi:MAG TPA: response regulator transcription factor [Gemmatimonadaceae bacterium]|nr:response regulator transcription factor [Gemmatimonadaceae bacterium]